MFAWAGLWRLIDCCRRFIVSLTRLRLELLGSPNCGADSFQLSVNVYRCANKFRMGRRSESISGQLASFPRVSLEGVGRAAILSTVGNKVEQIVGPADVIARWLNSF